VFAGKRERTADPVWGVDAGDAERCLNPQEGEGEIGGRACRSEIRWP
jgi:hypothetical protein